MFRDLHTEGRKFSTAREARYFVQIPNPFGSIYQVNFSMRSWQQIVPTLGANEATARPFAAHDPKGEVFLSSRFAEITIEGIDWVLARRDFDEAASVEATSTAPLLLPVFVSLGRCSWNILPKGGPVSAFRYSLARPLC